MTTFSQHFKLNKSQAELDFVDIDLINDIPLYIDPYSFTSDNDLWSEYCHHLVATFFQEVVDSIKNNNKYKAITLLSQLSEPEENHLGVSKPGNKGRGIGPKQAAQIFDALRKSPASSTGLLSDLSDFALFIPNIGRDKISDITTNVVRGPLIEYTQKQCNLYSIPMFWVPSGLVWNPDIKQWQESYVNLPICNGNKIILTPKFVVRYRVGVDRARYRTHFVLNFLRDKHLRAGDGLVTLIKNAKGEIIRKKVLKSTLDKHYPDSKDFLAQFSIDHPDVIDRYRKTLISGSKILPNINPKGFSEEGLANHLAGRLRSIKPGKPQAGDYHNLMIGIISFLFYPNLIYPEKEFEINEGRKRIDIIYTNAKVSGLFNRVAYDQNIKATIVHVECKNYLTDIANPEFDQLLARFDINRGRLGFLAYRGKKEQPDVMKRCRDAAKSGLGIVLPMNDAYLLNALKKVEVGKRAELDKDLDYLFRSIIN